MREILDEFNDIIKTIELQHNPIFPEPIIPFQPS